MVSGIPVIFKASFVEPSKTIGAVYELIYHPSGKLTSDWSGENEVDFKAKKQQKTKTQAFIQPQSQARASIGGSCGRKSSGAC